MEEAEGLVVEDKEAEEKVKVEKKVERKEIVESRKKMKVNLGCGKDYRNGFVNVDKESCGDVLYDLNKLPYPFDNEGVDEFLAYHVIEHLELPFKDFLDEIRRCLKVKGTLIIKVPIGFMALGVNHKQHFNISNFSNVYMDSEMSNMFEGWIVIERKFLFMKCGKVWFFNRMVEWIINKIRWDVYCFSFLYYLFSANELYIKMVKIR